jgi:MFS family permease
MGAMAYVGWFYSAIAIGALIATLTSGWAKHIYRHGLMVALAAGGWGIAIIFFGISSDNLYLALFFLGAAGYCDMISGIFRQTMWNQSVPDKFRGRLAGIEMISFLSGPMLGDAESGFVAYFTNVKTSIISGGVLTVIGTLVLAFLLPKFISYDSRNGLKLKEREDAEHEREAEQLNLIEVSERDVLNH